MTKVLLLKFTNAKLFRNAGKDVMILSSHLSTPRVGSEYFVEPITYYQVSNMLHVLFGERPAPSLRRSVHKRLAYYDAMALSSYIKIDTTQFITGKNQLKYPSEILRLNKGVWNSWKTRINVTWEVIRLYLDNKYDWFIHELTEHFDRSPLAMSFEECEKLIKDDILFYQKFIYDLKERKLGGLTSYFEDHKNSSLLARKENKITRHNTAGIDRVLNLSGSIIVPITEDDLIKLNQSTGIASILDGGLVNIDGISNENEVSVKDYTKMSDISCEKKIYER